MTTDTTTSALTARQERFVREFLLDLSATQAAIRAGYSARTAKQAGSRLLTNVVVQRAIGEAKQERAQRTGIEADRVLEELARVGFSDISHYVIEDSGNVTVAAGAPETAMRAVRSVKRHRRSDKAGGVVREVEIRLWDKVSALEKLARHLGMFDGAQPLAAGLTIRVVRE